MSDTWDRQGEGFEMKEFIETMARDLWLMNPISLV